MNKFSIKYIYCILENGEDFVTTSFDVKEDKFIVNNVPEDLDINKIKYLSYDYVYDIKTEKNGFINTKRYSNSSGIKHFEVEVSDFDMDRMILILKVKKEVRHLDVKIIKRDLKIKSIIE